MLSNGLMTFFVVGISFYFYLEAKKEPNSHNRWFFLGVGSIVTLGIFVRFFQVETLPGLQIDEAMAGYDAWALAHYGQDSALNSWPVYLVSYGTGQSALYAYLSIPFIKLLGLSVLSIRLAMLLVSVLTLFFTFWVLYAVIKLDKTKLFFSVLILSFNPWHIMLSRFGLDANLAPQFFLISILCFIWGRTVEAPSKRLVFKGLAILFLALTAYAYIASWLMLPFFCVAVLWQFRKEFIAEWQQWLLLSGCLCLLLIPLFLFAYNQFFGGADFSFLGITIPKMPGTQLEGQTIFNQNSLGASLLDNMQSILRFIFVGHLTDGLVFNGVPGFGAMYYGSFIFFCIGLTMIWKERTPFLVLIKTWLVSCLPLLLVTKPLVHHWNLLFFPTLFVIAYGVAAIYQRLPISGRRMTIICWYTLFGVFGLNYFIFYREGLLDSGYLTPPDLKEVIQEVNAQASEQVVIFVKSFPQAENEFIYIRFHDPIEPYQWQAMRDEPFDPDTNMTKHQYGKYLFSSEETIVIEENPKVIYLLHKDYPAELPENASYQMFENEHYYLIRFDS